MLVTTFERSSVCWDSEVVPLDSFVAVSALCSGFLDFLDFAFGTLKL